MSRYTIDLPEDQQDDPEVMGTELSEHFLFNALREHGADRDDFHRDRKDTSKPVTLGDLRNFLGY